MLWPPDARFSRSAATSAAESGTASGTSTAWASAAPVPLHLQAWPPQACARRRLRAAYRRLRPMPSRDRSRAAKAGSAGTVRAANSHTTRSTGSPSRARWGISKIARARPRDRVRDSKFLPRFCTKRRAPRRRRSTRRRESARRSPSADRSSLAPARQSPPSSSPIAPTRSARCGRRRPANRSARETIARSRQRARSRAPGSKRFARPRARARQACR